MKIISCLETFKKVPVDITNNIAIIIAILLVISTGTFLNVSKHDIIFIIIL